MKIVHYCHQLGLGGTEKCMQYLLEYLHGAGHDCYCIHNRAKTEAAGGYREGVIKNIVGAGKVFGHTSEAEFFEIMASIRAEIFHVHRSGRPSEFPIVPELRRFGAKCVETNVFGGYDPTDVIDLTLYVSDYLYKRAQKPRRRTAVLYNPVKEPATRDNLRAALQIPETTFVMGRIGRPDDHIFDPISLHALNRIESKGASDILYLVQSPPPRMVETATILGLKKIRFILEPIISDEDVSRFFNTIDVLAHMGRVGETFGLSIAEAMIHGKPVISHRSRAANGHETFVKRCGFFARRDDDRQYARFIRILYEDEKRRQQLGESGRGFAVMHFNLSKIGSELEGYYEQVLSER